MRPEANDSDKQPWMLGNISVVRILKKEGEKRERDRQANRERACGREREREILRMWLLNLLF